MGKSIGIVAIIILFLIGVVFFLNQQTAPEPSSSVSNPLVTPTQSSATPIADIKASFAIFTNGTFRIFTASMYHNLSEEVYIDAGNPNIVHVKKTGTTWNDFFSTLPFTLTPECLTTGTKETFCTGNRGTLTFYINGEANNNALSLEIHAGDKLLVSFGTESEEVINQQYNKIPSLPL